MRILLLGSNGLLGHNVLLTLLQQGHSVNALLRRVGGLHTESFPKKENLTIIEGSILDKKLLRQAAQGCQAIINCAGVTDMSKLHYEDYLPINRDLCKILIEIMEDQNIHCLVHTSTANTIGYGTKNNLADENAPIKKPFDKSFYAQSKQEGELLLIQAAQARPNDHIIIVNPGFMVGSYDTKPSSGTLLLAGNKKIIMVAPKGGKSFIHVADASIAIVNALTMGKNGQRYLLTGENLTIRQFYQLQAKCCNYPQILITVPNWMLSIAGYVGDLLRYCGVQTQVCTRNVRQLMVKEYYQNTTARNQLKMPATPISQAVTDFFSWYYKENQATKK